MKPKQIKFINKNDIYPKTNNLNILSENAKKTEEQVLKILLEMYYNHEKTSFN